MSGKKISEFVWFPLIGFALGGNYILNVYTKLISGLGWQNFFWACPLMLLLASIGFLLRRRELIAIAFVGSFYMMILWLIDLGGFFMTGHFFLNGITKFIIFDPLPIKIASLFHLFLPLICLIGIWGRSFSSKLWVKAYVFFLVIFGASLFFGREMNINFVYRLMGFSPGILIEVVVLPIVVFFTQRVFLPRPPVSTKAI